MSKISDNRRKITLLDLKSGQTATVVSVSGDVELRRRITEMGFVRGQKVMVVKNAPLKDPIEYTIMGYDVSLRRREASLIEVMLLGTETAVQQHAPTTTPITIHTTSDAANGSADRKRIEVALIGNPNSGKTSLFNYISGLNEHVGNYSGVTVDSKSAEVVFRGYTIRFTDLPGTYSLSVYSPEELFVRRYIAEHRPDVIVNVVDGSNLERNLYLTTQLIDMEVNLVVALNMYDELIASGDKFNHRAMGELLGATFIPTIAKRGRGVPHLLQAIVERFNNSAADKSIGMRINYGQYIESGIEAVEEQLKDSVIEGDNVYDTSNSRFMAIKLLEKDSDISDDDIPEGVKEAVVDARRVVKQEYSSPAETVLADARYGFISGALKETYVRSDNAHRQSEVIDTIITHKLWGFPVFLLIMWVMFYTTFTLGEYPMLAIEWIVGEVQIFLTGVMSDGAFKDLLINGIIGGVGSVVVFLPNILLLFLFISILEDSGYMARAAFIMDKIMHKIGLHGKSFIPLIMGFGCNVPAIMATRIIEDRRGRILTILIAPFMSCSARLPVYLLIVGAFFPENAGNVLFGVYVLGIVLAVLSAMVFKRWIVRGKDQPFVMELPPYRVPSARSTVRHMWNKGSQYLKKMGGIILVAVVIVWALSNYPKSDDKALTLSQQQEQSYLGRVGHAIEPVVKPLGFDWKIGVGLVSGIAAKEIIVSTMGVINQVDVTDVENEHKLAERLKDEVYISGDRVGEKVYNKAVALSFLMFVLIYFPCIAVVTAIRRETGAWKWAVFTMVYTTLLAWVVSFVTYNIANVLV